jgi:hypothetical protein
VTDWHERYERARHEHGRVQVRTARMLGRLSFLLAQPGVTDAIRTTLPNSQTRNVLDTLLDELDAWPARPPTHVGAGDALMRLVEADGHLPADQLPMRAGDTDRLRHLGLITTVAGPGYELTTAGWSWCERAADLETRIRTLYHTMRADHPELGPEVPLADIRDELARHQLSARADINAAMAALHEAGVIILSADRTRPSNSHTELVINGEPRHLLTVRPGAPRAIAVRNPWSSEQDREHAWPTERLTDAERHLAHLWSTFREDEGDEDGLVGLNDERAGHLDRAAHALAEARVAAEELDPSADVGSLAKVAELVGWLRADLTEGMWPLDVTGGSSSYAASIDEAIERAWVWEEAERSAGRPMLTEAQVVADITERLSWDRPRAQSVSLDGTQTRTWLQSYAQPQTARLEQPTSPAEPSARSPW